MKHALVSLVVFLGVVKLGTVKVPHITCNIESSRYNELKVLHGTSSKIALTM